MEKEKEGFWRSLGWSEWTILALVPIIAIGVAAIISPAFRSFVADSATAAWVQALGSIGAIFVAIGVARHQTLESERKAAEQRKHDADFKRMQGLRALKSILAELTAIQSKRLVSLEDEIASLEKGENFPDIPLTNNDFQVYRRSAYLLAQLEDSSLVQRIHDAYSDIDTFRMSLALYARLRFEYLEAARANEGQYNSRTYLHATEAKSKLKRQAQDSAAKYTLLKDDLVFLLRDITAACLPSDLRL